MKRFDMHLPALAAVGTLALAGFGAAAPAAAAPKDCLGVPGQAISICSDLKSDRGEPHRVADDHPPGWDRGKKKGWEKNGEPKVGARYDGWENHRVRDWDRYGLRAPEDGTVFAVYGNQIVKIDAQTGLILALVQALD